MVGLLSRERIFFAYLIALAGLLCSTIANRYYESAALVSPATWIVLAVIVLSVIFYAMGRYAVDRFFPTRQILIGANWTEYDAQHKRTFFWVLVGIFSATVIGHLLILPGIPGLRALASRDDFEISVIRQEGYLGVPMFLRYLSDYSVKAIGPMVLILAYSARSRAFYPLIILAALYSLALYARIMPIFLFAPLLLYTISLRRYRDSLGLVALIGGILLTTSAIASPNIRDAFFPAYAATLPQATQPSTSTSTILAAAPAIQPDQAPKLKPRHYETSSWQSKSVLYSLFSRIIVIPGGVILQWFNYYSDPKFREYGCGYRPASVLLGCQYVNVPTKLYAHYYPKNVNEFKLQGSLNAAFFMTEYANFGPLGVILSSVAMAFVLLLATQIFGSHPLAIPLNIAFIVVAMETNLLTALNSGSGWIITSFLFLYFFRTRTK